jgi:hypothetical protein
MPACRSCRARGRASRRSSPARATTRTRSPPSTTARATAPPRRRGLTLEGPVRKLGRVGATAEIRRFDERYRSPGRLDPVFYEEEWGVNANRPLKAQDRRTGILTWKPLTLASLRAEYAELSADSGFFARRRGVSGDLAGIVLAHGRIERVDNRQQAIGAYSNDGYRNKAQASAAYTKLDWLRPEASIDFEDRVPPSASDSAAARYRQWDAGAAFPRLGPVDLSVGVGQRFDAARDSGAWLARTRADRVKSALQFHAGGSISGALGFERRLTVPEVSTAPPRATSDAGYARFRQGLRRAGRRSRAGARVDERGAGDPRARRALRRPGGWRLRLARQFRRTGRLRCGSRVDRERSNAWPGRAAAGASTSIRATRSPTRARGRTACRTRASGSSSRARSGRRGSVELSDLVYGPSRLLNRTDVATGSYVVRPELELGSRSRWLGFLFRGRAAGRPPTASSRGSR